MYKNLKFVIAAFGAALLMGCGGGGGGGDGGGGGGTVSLGGIASKGFLIGATVQAYEVKSDGSLVALGESGITNANGGYTLPSLPVTSNPVIVQVTANSTTTMLDETLPLVGGKFQLGVAPAVGTVMRSYVTDLTVGNTVYITPFSEMAVSAAGSANTAGKLDAASLFAARDMLTATLGFDPFKTQPVNADAIGLSTDQSELILLLTAVAKSAALLAPTCTDDPSGMQCAMKAITDAATLVKDSVSGNYSLSTPTLLNQIINDAVIAVKSDATITNPQLTNVNITAAATSDAIDPVASANRASMESFIEIMRTGFKTASESITLGANEADARIAALAIDIAANSTTVSQAAFNNCDASSGTLLCTSGNGTTFTQVSTGSYNYSYSTTDTNVTGTFSANADTSSGTLAASVTASVVKKIAAVKVMDLDFQLSGSGLSEPLTNFSLAITKLNAKVYGNTVTNGTQKYESLIFDETSISSTDGGDTIKITSPFSITTSDGDSFIANINDLSVVKIQTQSAPVAYKFFPKIIDISMQALSASTNLFSVDLNCVADYKNFNPSSANSYGGIESLASYTLIGCDSIGTLSNNVSIRATETQSSYENGAVGIKLTSNNNWLNVSANLVRVVNGRDYLLPNPNEITVTSSGDYSASITDQQGDFSGKVFKGTTQIGTVTNGIMYVNGIIVSLF